MIIYLVSISRLLKNFGDYDTSVNKQQKPCLMKFIG